MISFVMDSASKDVMPHSHTIRRGDRSKLLNQKPLVIWFTGLSGSGKSTLADELEKVLHERGKLTYILDGDTLRSGNGLCSDLDFTPAHRTENIRRVGAVTRLLYDAGLVVVTSFVSPYQADRDAIRASLPEGELVEIFVDCPVEVCEERDTKGLYAKARAGELTDFTGVNAPYESPENPEISVDTNELSIEQALVVIIEKLEKFL